MNCNELAIVGISISIYSMHHRRHGERSASMLVHIYHSCSMWVSLIAGGEHTSLRGYLLWSTIQGITACNGTLDVLRGASYSSKHKTRKWHPVIINLASSLSAYIAPRPSAASPQLMHSHWSKMHQRHSNLIAAAALQTPALVRGQPLIIMVHELLDLQLHQHQHQHQWTM